jgi:2-dehydro-3-deoxygluconokinase
MTYDVLVIGEILVELSSAQPLGVSRQFDMSFSGDTLNAAAAAAAAGAKVGLVACVGDDEFGRSLLSFIEELGLDRSPIRMVDRPNGIYFTGADPTGAKHFIYSRQESAGTLLCADDVDEAMTRSPSAVIVSGVTCAISATAAAAVERAAREVNAAGGLVVYDPNYRARLASPFEARRSFERLAPYTYLVTPSCPSDSMAMFGVSDPTEVGSRVRDAGAHLSLVTLGEKGALLDDGQDLVRFAAASAPSLVDATGCGDVLVGTLTARLALGDDIDDAIHLSMAAAALSLGGRGGTGYIPFLEETRALARESRWRAEIPAGTVGQPSTDGQDQPQG